MDFTDFSIVDLLANTYNKEIFDSKIDNITKLNNIIRIDDFNDKIFSDDAMKDIVEIIESENDMLYICSYIESIDVYGDKFKFIKKLFLMNLLLYRCIELIEEHPSSVSIYKINTNNLSTKLSKFENIVFNSIGLFAEYSEKMLNITKSCGNMIEVIKRLKNNIDTVWNFDTHYIRIDDKRKIFTAKCESFGYNDDYLKNYYNILDYLKEIYCEGEWGNLHRFYFVIRYVYYCIVYYYTHTSSISYSDIDERDINLFEKILGYIYDKCYGIDYLKESYIDTLSDCEDFIISHEDMAYRDRLHDLISTMSNKLLFNDYDMISITHEYSLDYLSHPIIDVINENKELVLKFLNNVAIYEDLMHKIYTDQSSIDISILDISYCVSIYETAIKLINDSDDYNIINSLKFFVIGSLYLICLYESKEDLDGEKIDMIHIFKLLDSIQSPPTLINCNYDNGTRRVAAISLLYKTAKSMIDSVL